MVDLFFTITFIFSFLAKFLGKCYVISVVFTLIDHTSRPISPRGFAQLLLKKHINLITWIYVVQYTLLYLKGLYLKEHTVSVCFGSGINPYRLNAIESSDEISHTTMVSGFILIKRAFFFRRQPRLRCPKERYHL